MNKFLAWLDDLAGTSRDNTLVQWLERVVFVFLILMVVSAPHSIAATQTAWITGMFVWIIRLFVRPHVKFKFGPLDLALWIFFLWSALTSVVSYDPATSIDKLRGTALFLIFYFVFYNLRSLRAVYFIAFALIVSCMVNVVWMPIQRIIGRGVEVHGLAPESPLTKALVREGDALLTANGKKLGTPEDLIDYVEQNEVTKVMGYRPDYEFTVDVKRMDVLRGSNALEQLGIESWKKSRNWRSRGFYGHYTTYAEVLQLIASLSFGLFIAAFVRWGEQRKKESSYQETLRSNDAEDTSAGLEPKFSFRIISVYSILLFILFTFLGLMSLALLMTVTRASQLAFIISAFFIVLIGAGRKMLLTALLIGLPIILIGLFFLQQSRQVGFFDSNDDSIKWRQTVWREGFDLWKQNPRHFMLGVGMDSNKKFAKQWRLYDDGRLPMGHFHSTPLQLVIERGLPALLMWLAVLGIYARTLWRGIRAQRSDLDAQTLRRGDAEIRIDRSRRILQISSTTLNRGILLGCLGGMIGFFTSGLVHYNLGDQEVVMVFFLLLGLGIKVAESAPGTGMRTS